MHRKLFSIKKEFAHLTKTCTDEIVHSADLRICDFCIWKNICAADLRILCTTVFRTFAHLHFTHLQIWRKSFAHRKCFLQSCAFVNSVLHICRTCKFVFFRHAHKFSQFLRFLRKSRNLTKMRKCPILSRRFLTCSRKCPKKAHVFLSGTRVVPGPTRLTTQGGKSRQNMH